KRESRRTMFRPCADPLPHEVIGAFLGDTSTLIRGLDEYPILAGLESQSWRLDLRVRGRIRLVASRAGEGHPSPRIDHIKSDSRIRLTGCIEPQVEGVRSGHREDIGVDVAGILNRFGTHRVA